MMTRALGVCWLAAALLLSACGAAASRTAADAPGAAAGALVQQTTAAVAPTIDPASPDALATAVAGPEMATAMAMAASADSEGAALIPLPPDDPAVVFDMTNIKSYSWVITGAPEEAKDRESMVIKQGTDQEAALDLAALDQYFPVAGHYTLRLTLVDTQDQTIVRDFALTR
jgi:hypothetical protein